MTPTSSQTVGPFFDFCLTPDTRHGVVFPDSRPRIPLALTVLDGAGAPVSDAVVEIWQAGDVPGDRYGLGRLGTGEDGTCEFDTVRPCDPDDGGAAHINICLFGRGLLRHLHTRLYFAGDPRLTTDPVLALVPEARRSTLVAETAGSKDPAYVRSGVADVPQWAFTIRLQGAGETVFFDA
jgi:protocatechuate 3,4-dioxygenase alpha subunit